MLQPTMPQPHPQIEAAKIAVAYENFRPLGCRCLSRVGDTGDHQRQGTGAEYAAVRAHGRQIGELRKAEGRQAAGAQEGGRHQEGMRIFRNQRPGTLSGSIDMVVKSARAM
jgi:hypothetical protein